MHTGAVRLDDSIKSVRNIGRAKGEAAPFVTALYPLRTHGLASLPFCQAPLFQFAHPATR